MAAPGFAEYEQALSGCGCEVFFYELKEENGFAYQEDYLQKITEELDMVFLCNPNNPTGGTVDRPFLLLFSLSIYRFDFSFLIISK